MLVCLFRNTGEALRRASLILVAGEEPHFLLHTSLVSTASHRDTTAESCSLLVFAWDPVSHVEERTKVAPARKVRKWSLRGSPRLSGTESRVHAEGVVLCERDVFLPSKHLL